MIKHLRKNKKFIIYLPIIISGEAEMEYVIWLVLLFIFTFVIGVIAPISGVGGGVLFVPLTTAFFPFNIDFVRGAGLAIALTSALSSSPRLLEKVWQT